MTNIYLIGMMGCGKTTVGRHLSKYLRLCFYDSDHEIEKKTGVKIPVIFELEGESGFRKREWQAIQELTAQNGIVLATGGGAVLMEENRVSLKKSGQVIYLRATAHELWLRTRNDKNRPLLQNTNARSKLEELLLAREPYYLETAHHIVETAGQPVSMIVQQIEAMTKAEQK